MTKSLSQKELIAICLSRIEEELGWGDSKNWSNPDFAKLSEVLESRTGVLLSLTTLKRIWGKVKYDNQPTTTTLNALANYCGFENWRSFVISETREFRQSDQAGVDVSSTLPPQTTLPNEKKIPKRRRYVQSAIVPASVFIFSFFLFFIFKDAKNDGRAVLNIADPIDTSLFFFSVNKVVTYWSSEFGNF